MVSEIKNEEIENGAHTFLSVDMPRPLKDGDASKRDAITIIADNNNAGMVYVGNRETQVVPLSKGQSITIRHSELGHIYWKGDTANDKAYFVCGGV